MNKNEFIELVYNYGASGDRIFQDWNLKLKEEQKQDVYEAWYDYTVECDNETSDEKADEIIANHYPSFIEDGRWRINFNPKDSEGYYISNGGMVDCEGESITDTFENAISFETYEEAQNWINENKNYWGLGDFDIW